MNANTISSSAQPARMAKPLVAMQPAKSELQAGPKRSRNNPPGSDEKMKSDEAAVYT